MTTMVADIERHSFSKSLDWPLGFLIFLRISGLNDLHITVSDAARCHCLYSRCDAKQSSLSVHHYSEPLFLRTILGGCFWSLINADFFYVCNRPWFSDEYPWRLHYIPSLGSLGLLNFYLNQKQRFPVRRFTENTNFISFYGRILSRYSGRSNLKIRKDLTFQN